MMNSFSDNQQFLLLSVLAMRPAKKERFQSVPPQTREVGKACCDFQSIQSKLGLPREARELLDRRAHREAFGSFAPITHDHCPFR